MWILDIDPKEIKNPFEGYVDVTENIRMAKSQGFERFRKLILAHAHEIDLNKRLREYYKLWLKQYPPIDFEAFMEKCPLSQFLSELKPEEKK